MNKNDTKHIVRLALCEDIPSEDVTTNALVGENDHSMARIFVKESAVVCGLNFATLVFQQLDPQIRVILKTKEGQQVSKNTTIMTIEGRARAILSGERTALNFLSYLSAIATKTNRFVKLIKPYKCRILDTRKTTPTLRFIERYAVRIGGGINHRDNLSSAVMIKDNHWVFSKNRSLIEVIEKIKKTKSMPVIVEVDNLNQLREVLQSKADIILLDNMKPAMVKKALEIRKKMKLRIPFEVSGNVSIKSVRKYASTGVERISIGGLTHSRQAIDFSLELLR